MVYDLEKSRFVACGACVIGVGLVVIGAVLHSMTSLTYLPLVSGLVGILLFAGGVIGYRHVMDRVRRGRGPDS